MANEAPQKKCALVVGAFGVVGSNLIKYLQKSGNWEIIGVARRVPKEAGTVKYLSLDLLNRAECFATLSELTQVTHVFYTAWSKKPTEPELVETNGQMISNLLDPLEEHAKNLQHVAITTGTKYYGSQLGAFKTPAKENDPRHEGLNFYYTLEDYIKNKRWTWSVARPHTVIGYAHGNPMNLGVSVAVYAAIAKELNMPFVFPGHDIHYNGLVDMSDVRLVAELLVWSATEPRAANQAFNAVNGDIFRWKHMWSKVTEYFGLPQAEYKGQFKMEDLMADKGPVWDVIVKKHHLQAFKMEELAPWWFINSEFDRPYEVISDMSKARDLGFTRHYDSEKTLIHLFDQLKKDKVIPQ